MDHFDTKKLDPMSADRVHLEAETAKLAYSARNKLIGDSNFFQCDLEEFYTEEIVASYADRINLGNVLNQEIPNIENTHKDTDTTHLSVTHF